MTAMQHLHVVTAASDRHVSSMRWLHAAGEAMHVMHRGDALTLAEGQDMQDLHEAPNEHDRAMTER